MTGNKSLMVTGGTGFLGLHTCQHFSENGWDVTAFDLEPFRAQDKTEDIKYVRGDVRDESAVRKALATSEADVIVHSAAALPLWDAETIRDVTVRGTRTVLRIAHELDIDRVVYISSTAVYDIHASHPITESSPLEGVGPYGSAKIEAERICEDFRRAQMVVPVLRPKTFIGPQRLGVFQILFDWVSDGAHIPMVGNGDNRYQLLHVDDLVKAIELVLTKEVSQFNDNFNVGATEYLTMRQDFQSLIDKAGTGKRVIGTPATLTIFTLRILNALGLSPLYPWVYETAAMDSYVSVEKLRELGWSPSYSNREALIDTYEWYVSNSPLNGVDSGRGHRVGWDQGVLSLMKQVLKRI